MGYMGFGMQKENYNRKPKKVFKKTRELYGDRMENYTQTKLTDQSNYGDLSEFYKRNTTPLFLKILRIVIFLIAVASIVGILWH